MCLTKKTGRYCEGGSNGMNIIASACAKWSAIMHSTARVDSANKIRFSNFQRYSAYALVSISKNETTAS